MRLAFTARARARALLFACTSFALAAAAACASSEDGDQPASRPSDPVTVPTTDASPNDAGADSETAAGLPRCSAAGWCVTSLPDVDLALRDIWLPPNHAFALAESPTLGVKVLEWSDSEGVWKYIDDNTQNELGGSYAGTIWAPSGDEVYYAAAPSYVFHGTRRAPPETGWSWSHEKLEDNSHKGETNHASHDHGKSYYAGLDYTALGVWGTGSDDVYAWYSNTIYHWRPGDDATPRWTVEFIANDPDSTYEHLFFVSATGTGPDDVWFGGARDSCALAVHKAADGYHRVADAVFQGDSCAERPGVTLIDGARGWLTDLQSMGPGAILGLRGAHDIARLSIDGDHLSASFSPVPEFTPMGAQGTSNGFSSLWRAPDELWLTMWGLIVRGGAGDSGAYEVSTLSLNGAPLNTAMYRIRGTSSTNIWAIGDGYALHKTTP
jgi:hypothetical protein